MRKVVYYQTDKVRYNKVFQGWCEECETGDLPFQKRVFVEPVDMRFIGKEGELSYFLYQYKGDISELVIVIGNLSGTVLNTLPAELFTIILSYPETSFIFESPDNIVLKKFEEIINQNKNLLKNEIKEEKDPRIKKELNRIQKELNDVTLEKDLICFDAKRGTPFLEFLFNVNDLFDASNMRGACRILKRYLLKVLNNLGDLQNKRTKSLALIIDEEVGQSILNSYLLYANGYRCLPITTYQKFNQVSRSSINYDVIIRDFDLQFRDEEDSEVDDNYNIVDLVRGYKYDNKNNSWISLLEGINEYSYWKAADYENGKVFVITQGYEHLMVAPSFIKKKVVGQSLIMPGLIKPLNGVYYSIRKLKPLFSSFEKDSKDKVKRSRVNNEHSYPLDLYDLASRMYERASKYYEEKKYIHAAVVSQEAFELLNCFHVALSIQIYHLHAIAENAIAMEVIGGNEEELAKDCEIRIEIIKTDIGKIMMGTDQDSRNVLNQIFSDCRAKCKEKEHFRSEEVFVSEMAYLNEGFFNNIRRKKDR